MARSRQRNPALDPYRGKRRFNDTPEPEGAVSRSRGHRYVIQKHAARRLHYDLRLELDGVLKSWAVTRGPSLDPSDKRLAVRTEDHPTDYADFEGRIPEGSYGAGTVMIWDAGTWSPCGDPHAGLEEGKLKFELSGERLRGRWVLVRMRPRKTERRENWLLIKESDEHADDAADVTAGQRSVVSQRSLKEIAEAPEAVWRGGDRGGAAGRPSRGKRGRHAASRLPRFVKPQLATLALAPSGGGRWLYEIKFDGYRSLAGVDGGEVRIWSRSGLDWTDRYRDIAEALSRLDLDRALLDGEIVVLDRRGRSDFSALQRRLRGEPGTLTYFVFDLLAEQGNDLRRRPLKERKERLGTLLAATDRTGPVFFCDHVEGDHRKMLDALCERDFEGIIAKRAGSAYTSGRSRAWLKIKCGHEQEFVIVGWSPSDKRRPFASLLLALNEGGRLRYAGRVGSGFSTSDMDMISKRLRKLSRKTPALEAPRAIASKARWVRPELVAEIAFAGFTDDGMVRHGRYKGLREDKPAERIVREKPVNADR